MEGRVEVNGSVVRDLGIKVDPEVDVVKVDGKRIYAKQIHYYAVNKPIGYVSSNKDQYGRPLVVDLIPSRTRLFTVGRLDINSWGLIIVTNDGDAAHRLSHPRFAPEKEYHVLIKGWLDEKELKSLERGIVLEEGRTAPARVKILWSKKNRTLVSITVKQGWYRMVRRMFMALGKEVKDLCRVRIGDLTLKGIEEEGMWRELKKEEIERLLNGGKGNKQRKKSPHR
jgi:23S rRNA pseudouridine2605 synthase